MFYLSYVAYADNYMHNEGLGMRTHDHGREVESEGEKGGAGS